MEKPENKLHILQIRYNLAQFITNITTEWLIRFQNHQDIDITKINTLLFNINTILKTSSFDPITVNDILACIEQLKMIKIESEQCTL